MYLDMLVRLACMCFWLRVDHLLKIVVYLINESLIPPLLYLYQIFIFILYSGEKGISPNTGKSLHYKGSFFHQIIKGSIVQVCCSIYTCIGCYMVVLLLYKMSCCGWTWLSSGPRYPCLCCRIHWADGLDCFSCDIVLRLYLLSCSSA